MYRQVIIDQAEVRFEEVTKTNVGASFLFQGTLIKSLPKGKDFEMQLRDALQHSAFMYDHYSKKTTLCEA